MAMNTLCTVLRRMAINKQCNIMMRYNSIHASGHQRDIPRSSLLVSNKTLPITQLELSVRFTPGSLNIDLGKPIGNGIGKNIYELPLQGVPSIEEPAKQKFTYEDLPISDKTLDLPTIENISEKRAISMIRIRRKKMKKHKMRKLRKKMKYAWEKIRVRRNLAKEKVFKIELQEKMQKAEAFNAKAYVADKLAALKKERLPYTWRGEILPQEQIAEFVKEKKERKEAKLNKPRLKL